MNTKWKSIRTAAIPIQARHTIQARLWHSFTSTKEENAAKNAFAYGFDVAPIIIIIFQMTCVILSWSHSSISHNFVHIFHRSDFGPDSAQCHSSSPQKMQLSATDGAKGPFISFSFCAALRLNCSGVEKMPKVFDRCTSISSFGACMSSEQSNSRVQTAKNQINILFFHSSTATARVRIV